MRRLDPRRFWLVFVPLAAVLAALAVIVATTGEDEVDRGTGPSGDLAPDSVPSPPTAGAPSDERSNRPRPDEEREAIRAVRAYVDAVDDRDGARVCSTLAPGAMQSFRLPRERGGCAASLSRSIGYRDPRGYPVFESARIDSIGDVAIAPDDARVTATVVTEFADRDQPSIEDDLVYLARADGEWRIARPSAVLYRAVGRPDVPLEAVAPPD
jgi:ketosteroid isomerase-like protein